LFILYLLIDRVQGNILIWSNFLIKYKIILSFVMCVTNLCCITTVFVLCSAVSRWD